MKQKNIRIKPIDNQKKEKIIKTITISVVSAFILAFAFCIVTLFHNIALSDDHSVSDIYDEEYIKSYANVLKKFSETKYTDEEYLKLALFKMAYEHYTMCEISDEKCLEEQANYHKQDIQRFIDIYVEENNYYDAAKQILADEAEKNFTDWANEDAINSYYIIEILNIFIIVFLVSINTIYFIFINRSKTLSKRISKYVLFSFGIYVLDIILSNANSLFFNHSINHICKYCSFSIGTDSFIVWRNGEFVKGFLNPLILLLIVVLSIIIHTIITWKKRGN